MFSEETIKKAWDLADGRCQCTRSSHGHLGKCDKLLVWENRRREGAGAWEANHINRVESEGGDELSNCEILCWLCHRQTL